MFWKRKKDSDDIFSLDSSDRRLYYRVSPSPKAPVVFEFNGKKITALDIGAGGLAFKNTSFKSGESHTVALRLPQRKEPVSAVLIINNVDDRNICHCRFDEIAADDIEAIHQYVLTRQKEIIHSRKEKNKRPLK